jgi:hypothetical protein
MKLSAHQRREWLRSRARDASDRDISLFQAIDNESKRLDRLTSGGSVAVSTSGNGRSVAMDNRFSPQDMQEVCGIARDVWEDAVVSLDLERDEKSTDNDEAILAAMLEDARFQRITGNFNNFIYLVK